MRKILFIILVLFLILVGYFFVGSTPEVKEIIWGVNFSQKHAENLKLDWKETYLALLDDLGVKNLKIITHWDLLEPERNEYDFEDLDWQIKTAQERGVEILLVIGLKTGRWPECHIPEWAAYFQKEKQEEKLMEMVEEIILRYRDYNIIKYWQVENEPFFPFGRCPEISKEFVEKEIALVRSLDLKKRPIVFADSGEGSFWIKAAQLGDIVGTTIYKKVWFRPFEFLNEIQKTLGLPDFLAKIGDFGFYVSYPFPPAFYGRKAQIISKLFNKEVICIELQAEPWGATLLYDSPLAEQVKTMNEEQFRYNIEFAKKTGLREFYLWGGEWWFWLKKVQNDSKIWDEARDLFIN